MEVMTAVLSVMPQVDTGQSESGMIVNLRVRKSLAFSDMTYGGVPESYERSGR